MQNVTGTGTYLTTTPEAKESFEFLPITMLRIAGLPLRELDGLLAHHTLAWLAEEDRLLQVLSMNAENLKVQLHQFIGDCPDEEARKVLLAMKRACSHQKRIKLIPRDGELAQYVSSVFLDCMETYHALLEELEHHRANLSKVMDEDTRNISETIARLANTESVAKGLLLSSESLSTKLSTYLREKSNTASSWRKFESSLLRYLTRIAAKTSPFSTFTPVAFARLEVTGKHSDGSSVGYPADSVESSCYLNPNAMRPILESLQRACQVWLPVTVNPDVKEENGYYLVSSRQFEVGAGLVVDAKDTVFKLRASDTLRHIAAFVASAQIPLTLPELVASLVAAVPGVQPDQLHVFLSKLIEFGFLQATFHVDDYEPDLVNAILQHLRELPAAAMDGPIGEAQKLLESLAKTVSAYRLADASERRTLLSQVTHGVSGLYQVLNIDKEVPRTLMLEEAFCRVPSSFKVERPPEWERDFRRLSKHVHLFDLFYGYRRTQTAFFIEKYGYGGGCTNLLEFTADWREFLMRELPMHPTQISERLVEWNPYNLPEIEAWQSARTALYGKLMRAVEPMTNDVKDLSVDITDDFAIIGERVAPFRHQWSLDALGQVASRDGRTLFILNQLFSGNGHMFSRFLARGRGAQGTWRDVIQSANRQASSFGETVVDLFGYFGFPADVRPPVTDDVIAYPGTHIATDVNVIPVHDLELRHNSTENRLRLFSKSQERYLAPRYLGFILPYLLPPVGLLLALLDTCGRYTIMPTEVCGYELQHLADGLGGIVIPRMTIGCIVLSRRTWVIPRGALPERTTNMNDARWMSTLLAWADGIGIGPRFYVRAQVDSSSVGSNATHTLEDAKRKPQWIDLRAPLLVREFMRYADMADGYLILQEALPDAQDVNLLPISDRICELVLETHHHNAGNMT